MNQRVLIVECGAGDRALLSATLGQVGFRTIHVSTVEEARQLVAHERFDIVVIAGDRFGVAASNFYVDILDQKISIAFLFIETKPTDVEHVFGIAVEDFIARSAIRTELVARVRVLLKRCEREKASTVEPLRAHSEVLMIDHTRRQATFLDRKLDLTALEFDLLLYFARSPGVILSRDQILADVWGYSHPGYERTVVMHVCRLRRKLRIRRGAPSLIETVRGFGYRFIESPVDLTRIRNDDSTEGTLGRGKTG